MYNKSHLFKMYDSVLKGKETHEITTRIKMQQL